MLGIDTSTAPSGASEAWALRKRAPRVEHVLERVGEHDQVERGPTHELRGRIGGAHDPCQDGCRRCGRRLIWLDAPDFVEPGGQQACAEDDPRRNPRRGLARGR